ncbi:HNH endonuclease [Priestia megaterium]|uniref:HNH endonuclease n=1 Tax=Priestia megaterium TaxID=1404 RepID=UPI00244A9D5D|nr:HNH endonuclease [Priestia megaterium]MDH2363777.1 HNH endonuclease [Priestia megaterium]
MAKPTFDEVKKYFENESCTLLETTYINDRSVKMKFICTCGNHHALSFKSFKNGTRCKECGEKKRKKNRNYSKIKTKLSYEEVKAFFQNQGCTLLATEYLGAHKKVEYICICGNRSSIQFRSFEKGQRCCGSNRITYEDIKTHFENQGCTLLVKENVSMQDEVDYLCTFGKKHTVKVKYFKNGTRCNCEHLKKMQEKAEALFAENGCTLLGTYENSATPMEYICICGKRSRISYNNFKKGKNCRECGFKKLSNMNRKYTTEDVQNHLKQFGYTLTGEYVDSITKFTFLCPNNHHHSMSYQAFKQGVRCERCLRDYIGEDRRLTIEEVDRRITEAGMSRIGEYNNSHSPIRVICVCGEECEMLLPGITKGNLCKKCGQKKLQQFAISRRKSIQEVKNIFEEKGCILLSEKYVNYDTELDYICHCGSKAQNSFGRFLKANGCHECSKNTKPDFSEFSDTARKEGYKVLSESYVDAKTKIQVECPKGHKYGVLFRSFVSSGKRCKECFLEVMRERTRDKNPRWNPNLTDEERIQNRDYPEYESWRKEVFTRDHYTCTCCGKRGNDGTYLAAHHLQNFAEYPDLRHDLDNGVTLCEECHLDFHKKYKFSNNTKQQFEEYKKIRSSLDR